jgi:hypothetical protein
MIDWGPAQFPFVNDDFIEVNVGWSSDFSLALSFWSVSAISAPVHPQMLAATLSLLQLIDKVHQLGSCRVFENIAAVGFIVRCTGLWLQGFSRQVMEVTKPVAACVASNSRIQCVSLGIADVWHSGTAMSRAYVFVYPTEVRLTSHRLLYQRQPILKVKAENPTTAAFACPFLNALTSARHVKLELDRSRIPARIKVRRPAQHHHEFGQPS